MAFIIVLRPTMTTMSEAGIGLASELLHVVAPLMVFLDWLLERREKRKNFKAQKGI